MATFSSSFVRLRTAILAILLVGPLLAGEPERRIFNLSEKTSEAFGKLRPLLDAKDYAGVMKLLDELIPQVSPTSYDLAQILDIKAKLFATQDKYAAAIEPWRQALHLSDTYKYFDDKWTLDTLYFLAQLEYQEGLGRKVPAEQKQSISRAIASMKRWLDKTKNVTAEASMLYASMLFNQAVANSEQVDPELIEKAKAEVKRGLVLAIEPREGFYALLLVILQQEADLKRAAEVLELLVKQFPQKKGYWPTLMAFYLNMAGEAETDELTRTYYIRAINAIERAQAFGHMQTPKNNYNLVTLYITAGQYGEANDLLYAGLKSGGIESDPKTWGILGYYFQQQEQAGRAIEVLQEATQLFPRSGQLEVQIGEIYRDQENTPEAYKHYLNAVGKGYLEKPHVAYQLLAFAAYELKNYDEALKAIIEAEKIPESKEDKQLPMLKRAIEDAIKARDAKKMAAGSSGALL